MTEDGRKYTEKSMMAFLEGQPNCDEKWIAGVVRASSPEDIQTALQKLSGYGNQDRFEFLKRSFGGE